LVQGGRYGAHSKNEVLPLDGGGLQVGVTRSLHLPLKRWKLFQEAFISPPPKGEGLGEGRNKPHASIRPSVYSACGSE